MGTYETIEGNPHRDAQLAIRKNEHALRRMEHEDFAKAEELLQESLVADVTFAPAHNNLGHLYFLQQKYYLAAWEFEYAAKLMPTSGEPLNNLGLIYERIGRFDEAAQRYEAAIAINPESQEFASNLARLQVRRKDVTPETAQSLHEVLFKDDRPDWKDWAGEQLNTKYLAFKELSIPGGANEVAPSEPWIPALPASSANWNSPAPIPDGPLLPDDSSNVPTP
jgi:tetratricopeptide (TPR) repeat protein